MLAALKAKFEAVLKRFDGEAETELQEAVVDARKALTDVEAEVAKAEPSLTEFEAGLKTLLETAEPQLKADGLALLAKLVGDFAPLLGKAPAAGE